MKKCKICGKEEKYLKRGMCNKHYKQFLKFGEIKRSRYDPNEIIEYDDYAEIILYNKDCEEIARTLIDLDDIDKVKQYRWHLRDNGYVICESKKIRLHRLIMNCPDDKIVDHINHDKLDNRKSNLRICTHQQNNMNVSKHTNNSSGTPGVYRDSRSGKWVAQIRYNYKKISLGSYDTLEEAKEARKQAEIDIFGDYRNK